MRLSDALFLVLDTETTGLDPRADRVVELAVVATTSTALLAGCSVLVDPGMPIPAQATAIHGITDDEVAGQPNLAQALTTLGPLLRSGILVAHNAPFDAAFLGLPGPWICTLALARLLLPGQPSHGLQALRRALALDAPVTEAHRAGADALVTAALLRHLLTLLPAEVETVEDLLAFQAGVAHA